MTAVTGCVYLTYTNNTYGIFAAELRTTVSTSVPAAGAQEAASSSEVTRCESTASSLTGKLHSMLYSDRLAHNVEDQKG